MNDHFQLNSWGVGIVATLFAVMKAIGEMRENREQRAVRMLSWKAQKYILDNGNEIILTKSEILKALRTDNLIFSDNEKYVRSCISDFFHKLGRLNISYSAD